MESILIDAGPLIALFNKRDRFHPQSIAFLKGFQGRLYTTWPVITEAFRMLDFNVNAQINLLQWIHRGGLTLFPLGESHIQRLIGLCEKYDDVPMDLADASLIVAAENKGITKIASIDSDFCIYRDVRNRYLTNVFYGEH
ncbi:type II toxin-antitoxin system VapC family toxin [Negadavirga shengliensis]|uniref:Type II toxin-antitoxin system VapC family toxin n=1 Tax=Negadavirga shengliensis TaxID=1389218 RepID=A0ABV9SXV9_9BACT